jgi:hypothetical protein
MQNGQYRAYPSSDYLVGASLPHGDNFYQAEFLMISAAACESDFLLQHDLQSPLELSQLQPLR